MSSQPSRDTRIPLKLTRSAVTERLLARRAEIEEAITVRAFAVAAPSGAETPGYVEGLRAAIAAAIDHALAAIGDGLENVGGPPQAVLVQARNCLLYTSDAADE